jgi:hypothetical protein
MENIIVKVSSEAPKLPAVISVDGKTYHIKD